MVDTDEIIALQNFRDELEAERDWRIREFTRIKLLLRKLEDEDLLGYVNTYLKMTVPTIYAHWEGFCVASFKLLSEYINARILKASDVTYNLLTYANIDSYNKLKGKSSFTHKVEFSKLFTKILQGKIIIRTRINTKSNLNFDALKEIFEQFQLNCEKIQGYEYMLNTFVNVRNAIAHGENSIVIDKSRMLEYMEMVIELIDEVLVEQIDFLENKRYLKM